MGASIEIQIRELRRQRGMTQKELAEKMEVSFQTISKWENGVNMPDITHIPKLAEIFGVSADVILGLESLKQKPDWRRFDGIDYWNGNRKLFKLWKSLYWNDDYFSFLVRDVWKLNKPVDILDFGCGFGFLGRKLLPLVPKTSSYTGIELDSSEIGEAESFFKETDYPHEFIKQDIYLFEPRKKYDVVVALYLLSYVQRPEQLLEKMRASLKPDGMLLLIDSNMEVERAGWFSGLEREENGLKCPDFTKVWESEVSHKERDYRMGTKLPYLLKKSGFKNIQARISDRVIIYDPADEGKKETNDIFRYVYEHEDSYQGGPEYFAARGAGYREACAYADYYKRTKDYFDSAEPFAVKTSGLYFVYAGL
ncbi:MAG: helix-turn-helix domain-containing protein [Lachnospiraceae bacterium]|nr:helix-turn-helix domain-containing protein [Lachnospiraceae bacterium]